VARPLEPSAAAFAPGASPRSSLRGSGRRIFPLVSSGPLGCAVLAGSGVGILEARAIFLMSPCYEMPKTPILSAPSRACGGILLRDVICM